ncbi:MAG: hypothetical protein ACWGNV_01105, partial [Bacteroidales bacterium]
LSILVGTLLIYFIFRMLIRKVRKKNPKSRLVWVWKKFKSPVLVTLLLIDFVIIKELFTLDEQATLSVNHFIKVAIIFCVTWLVIKGIHLVREIILRQYDFEDEDNLKARKVYTQFRVLERILIFMVILIAMTIWGEVS